MPALASQEIVTVVDGQNRPVAELPRHRVRSENLPHRATYIFVFDRRGRECSCSAAPRSRTSTRATAISRPAESSCGR